jgi:hypothetical protein
VNEFNLVEFPNGSKYIPKNKGAEKMFAGHGISGTYKKVKYGVRFCDAENNPFLFLVCNKDGERFFVSCSSQLGKVWYMYSTSESTEKKVGLDSLSYMEKSELAKRIAKELGY